MRNRRGALWALGMAGAAYLWRNRAQLQQQLRGFSQRGQTRQLPDFGSRNDGDQTGRDTTWNQPRERQFGGTDV